MNEIMNTPEQVQGLSLSDGDTSLGASNNLLENTKLLNSLYKLAKIYANSSMVPQSYQRNPDNCFVALELANRMGVFANSCNAKPCGSARSAIMGWTSLHSAD